MRICRPSGESSQDVQSRDCRDLPKIQRAPQRKARSELGALFSQIYRSTLSWVIGPEVLTSWPATYRGLPVRSILTDYREIGQSVWARFQGGRDGTLWYYRALCDQFLRRKPNRLTREFALAVRELETVEKTESNMD